MREGPIVQYWSGVARVVHREFPFRRLQRGVKVAADDVRAYLEERGEGSGTMVIAVEKERA